MAKFKILVFHSVLPRFLTLVARELADHHPEISFAGIALSQVDRETVQQTAPGLPWESLSVFSEAVRQQGLDRAADLEYLEAMERKYGRPSLNLILAADWQARSYPYPRACRFLEIVFRFLTAEMERVQPNTVIAEGIDCALTHALYSLARARGIPYLLPGSGRLPGRFSIIGNPHDRWESAEKLFAEYLAAGAPAAAMEAAQLMVQRMTQTGPEGIHARRGERHKIIRRSDWAVLRELLDAHRRDPDNYNMLSPRAVMAQRGLRILRARRLPSYYNPPRTASECVEKYVVFPLHVQPEATTMTLAPNYVDQPTLIANIARSLPAGYYVYTKEHPVSVGVRSLEEYRRIRRIPNCRLLPTHTPVHGLLKNSAGVLTITGTMGLEGLMLGLPVVTFGRPFYSASGLTYDVDEPSKLPYILQKAFSSPPSDRQRLLTFLAASLEGSYEGQIGYERVAPTEAFGPENVARVARAFEQELQFRKCDFIRLDQQSAYAGT